jgi:hypothetical protein
MIKIKFRDETKSSFLVMMILGLSMIWFVSGIQSLKHSNFIVSDEIHWYIFLTISIIGSVILSIIFIPEMILETIHNFRRWKNEHYKNGVLEI